MNRASLYQNKEYLTLDQYNNSFNLSARAQLHQRFSEEPNGWFRWVFTHLELETGFQILECGCGPGWLWRTNLQELPSNCQITLTDLSAGMVAEAEQTLVNSANDFHFREADITALPFDDQIFDLVVANHMLYHVSDRDKAFSEVGRVLKSNGRFVAATIGRKHMRELDPLRQQLIPELKNSFRQANFTFSLENGKSQLEPWFIGIELHHYVNSLAVTETEPLLAYVLSSSEARVNVDDVLLDQARHYVQHIIDEHGTFRITTDSGLFVARNGT